MITAWDLSSSNNLSEQLHTFANTILAEDGIDFSTIDETSKDGQTMLAAISEESIEELGYFLKPSELFSSIDFAISNRESDVLGDAYEYLIGQFAAGAGKKAGVFYTPQAASTILPRKTGYQR